MDDLRESPSFELIRLLKEKEAMVDYHDYYIPRLHKRRKYDYDMQSISLDTISDYDMLILATDHDKYDYNMIFKEAKLIVDTRGRFTSNDNKIVKA